MADLNEDWTCDVISRLHRIRVSQATFAEKCGYTPQYVSMVLNGKQEFSTENAKKQTKDRMLACLEALEQEI